MKPAPDRVGLVAALTAAAVSILGSRMSFIAVPWLILVTTGSPSRMGLVAAIEMVPYVLAISLGAPLVDRLSPRRMAITADLASSAVLFGLATAYTGGFATIAVLVAVVGALRGLGDSSRKLLIPPMAGRARMSMVRVHALYDGISRLSLMIGAAVAGILIAAFGGPAAVLINAAAFVAAKVIVATTVRPTEADEVRPVLAGPYRGGPAREPYLTALRGGFRHVRGERLTAGIIGMLVWINMFNQASGVVFVPLWADELMHSPAAIGFVLGATALGGVVGNIIFTALAHRLPRYPTFTLGFLLGGAPRFLILAFSRDLETVIPVTFLAGIASAAVNPIISVVVYERTPRRLQARVFGLVTAAAWAGIPIGGLLGGWAVEGFGLSPALLLTGLLYFSVALTPVLGYRSWRQLSTLLPPEEKTGLLPPEEKAGGGEVPPADQAAVRQPDQTRSAATT